jgi:hypothetical protein
VYELDAWILGNILIGCGIGFIINVMTESVKHLTNTVRLKLYPSIFETHSEIDAYYDPLFFAAHTNWTKLKRKHSPSCDEPNYDDALKSRVTRTECA